MELTVTQFAEYVNRARGCIERNIKNGRLIVNKKGLLDTEHKRNKSYRETRPDYLERKGQILGNKKKYADSQEREREREQERVREPERERETGNRENTGEEKQQEINDKNREFDELVSREKRLKLELIESEVKIKAMRIKEKEGELINKKFILSIMSQYINILNDKIIDAPSIFYDRAKAFFESKNSEKKIFLDEVQDYIRDVIDGIREEFLREIKKQVEEATKD